MPENTLTDAQLDEIEARVKAATPGPWGVESHRVVALTVRNVTGWGVKVVTETPQPNADVVFIVHARNDVPALIAALREERRLIEVVRDFLGRDSWCAGKHDHADDVNACPCGYAQLRDAFNATRALGEQEAT